MRTIAHSLMLHARVLEAYIHFALMYVTYHILPVLPIKYLINEDGEPTMPFKVATGTKSSVSHLQKDTAHVRTKALKICHQAQKGFRGIFIGIPQHQKGYLVYIPSTRKIIYSYDVVFDEKQYITTIFRSDGCVSVCDIYTL